MSSKTDELAVVLADAFVRHLRDELTTDEWNEMAARNRAETEPGICHSHDFCDANVVMADAFKEATGTEPDIDADSDTDLWNAAWNLAKPRLAEARGTQKFGIDVSIVVELREEPSANEAAQLVIDSLRERIASGTADGVIQITDEDARYVATDDERAEPRDDETMCDLVAAALAKLGHKAEGIYTGGGIYCVHIEEPTLPDAMWLIGTDGWYGCLENKGEGSPYSQGKYEHTDELIQLVTDDSVDEDTQDEQAIAVAIDKAISAWREQYHRAFFVAVAQRLRLRDYAAIMAVEAEMCVVVEEPLRPFGVWMFSPQDERKWAGMLWDYRTKKEYGAPEGLMPPMAYYLEADLTRSQMVDADAVGTAIADVLDDWAKAQKLCAHCNGRGVEGKQCPECGRIRGERDE